MRCLLLAATALVPVAAHAACTTAAPNSPASSGGFAVLDGQTYTPDGKPFIAHGVNMMEQDFLSSYADLPTTFPGVNFVRVPVYDYADPSTFSAAAKVLTSQGIVVEFEDHSNSTGSNAGGGVGQVFTGDRLATELAWDARMAKAFKNNPYVWQGSNNEPAEPSGAALSSWQQQEYQAIRGAGSNSPIMLEINGWADPSSFGAGLTQSVYAGMTNTIEDVHFYGWLSGGSTDQATVSSMLAADVAAAQGVKSADGTMPVIIGEYGNSTTGMEIDANGDQVVSAVASSGLGSAAWAWGSGNPGDGLLDGNGALSAFGRAVAAHLAQSGALGCAASAIPDGPGQSLSASLGTQSVGSTPSIAEVERIALQGLDPSVHEAMAGAVPDVQMPIRTAASPGGTMPTPPPVSGWSTVSVTTDGGAVSVPTNGSGMVSGAGNVIQAANGVQTLTVTGPGNTINLGPYDDVVTLVTAGNTINLGGGRDTVVLAYGGGSSVKTNSDAAAVSPLASVGNVIVLPAPGIGVVTIQGVLASNDRLDLTTALAGSTWDHQPGTIWNYVQASASSSGCTISVGGHVVALLPGGSPSGNIGSFIVAK